MTNLELLDILSNIKGEYILQAQALRSGEKKAVIRKLSRKRALLIAAVISLLLLLVGCAAVLISLQKANLGHMVFSDVLWMDGTPFEKDVLSLSGYVDSPQYHAMQEWMDFENSYDQDRVLLKKADADGYITPPDYSSYPCYTEEMCAKIDELCEKYGLSLAGPIYFPATTDDVLDAVAVSSIENPSLGGILQPSSGRFFRSGSFRLDGSLEHRFASRDNVDTVNFDYMCSKKYVFFTTSITTDDIETFDSWEYTAWDGTKLLLAQNKERGLIFADTEDYFTSIVLYFSLGETLEINNLGLRKDMEEIADAFAYALQPHEPEAQWLQFPNIVVSQMNAYDPVESSNTFEDDFSGWMPGSIDSVKKEWEDDLLRALMDKKAFYSAGTGKESYLSAYCRETSDRIDLPVSVTHYTFVDMDADGIQEAVVDFRYGQNTEVACMVLRADGGTVFGEEFYYRQLYQLKVDGTFAWSGSSSNSGWARLRWGDNNRWIREPAKNGEGKADVQWYSYPLTADMREDSSFTLFREVFLPTAESIAPVTEDQLKTLCETKGFYFYVPYENSFIITMPGSTVTGTLENGFVTNIVYTLYLDPIDTGAAPYGYTLEVGVEQLNKDTHSYFIYRPHTTPIAAPGADALAEYINWHRVHPRDQYTNWDSSLIIY